VTATASRFDAIAFDLLTALVDSWSLWARAAGDEARGRAWRTAALGLMTAQGDYRPYEAIVGEAAAGSSWS
jgi:2-haloacid dehalogenase